MEVVKLEPKTSLNRLEKKIAIAESFDDWFSLCRQHDVLSGANEWRKRIPSSMYDFAEVKSRYDKMSKFLEEGATKELLYALNEGVHGNMGRMGQPILYSKAKCGTKDLIDNYVSVIAKSLEHVHEAPESEIPFAEKLDFFRRASHCYGRSALLLSGGAGLIYFHHGVAQELIDQDLLPNVLSGASAGSVVSAQLGTLNDEELKNGYFRNKRYEEPNRTRMLDVFLGRLSPEDTKMSRERLLDEIVPKDLTFQEAFEHTGRYINISISPAEKHQQSRLMNAIASPNVYIRSAVSASSSIPGVVAPERLYAKGFDGRTRPYLATRRWVDGSVSGDLPIKRLSRLYGVNHFIVSLINPMVVPFVQDAKSRNRKGFRSAVSESAINLATEWLAVFEKILDKGGSMGSMASSNLAHLIRMLEQNYLGDINILLEKKNFKWRQTVFEFKQGEIEDLFDAGMRSTWPKVAQIKNAALISKTLDRILEDLNQQGIKDQDGNKHHVYA